MNIKRQDGVDLHKFKSIRLFELISMSYLANDVRTSSVAKGMGHENLKRFGG